ncbi:NADH-quinone oxidoreductase subunit NuoK [Solimonas sp. K1W22B-7]|uniref:NADH-quinone oxidoreductase subunit NuoK n=1 Tax=Solimonas sp. K1W22B-7 TaxID=2303331 RepID=UPI001F09C23D|nr:NADH-quinone oxidoreductase subunit NuoK [Solimonas sp. K1W22B-7]
MTPHAIPMEHALLLAATLFALGLCGLVLRRNIIFMLMSIEVMMNATGLAFVTAGSRWGAADGQIMFILVLTLAAAEACVGLALVIQLYKRFGTLDVDAASQMKG